MNRRMLAGLVAMGLMACGQGKVGVAGADSTGRDLEFVPIGGDTAFNSPRVATNPPRTKTIGTTPATRTLAAGSAISATMGRTITSRSTQDGETVNTTVDADVRNAAGRVVVPAGSTVELTVTEIEPAKNKGQADGTLVLQVTGVTVRGQRYPIAADVTSVSHTLKGRGVTTGEVEKVAVGTAIGAIAGRVIGGNATGTIIGGAVGAAGGTVVAVRTASRDVVVSAGTPVVITLNGPLTVSAQ